MNYDMGECGASIILSLRDFFEILPFLFFPTFLQVKITPSDPSLDKSWTNTTELIMNNRNPEFNQTLVIEVCIYNL